MAFSYLTNNQKKIILREICKRTHRPSIVTLALLLFLTKPRSCGKPQWLTLLIGNSKSQYCKMLINMAYWLSP